MVARIFGLKRQQKRTPEGILPMAFVWKYNFYIGVQEHGFHVGENIK